MANAGESPDRHTPIVPPVQDDEFLYRKVAVSRNLVNAENGEVDSNAFKPDRERDTDGTSMDRAHSTAYPEFRTPQQAGTGPSRSGYYVVSHRVRDLRARGIDVIARPTPENPGHVVLPGLRADNRKTNDAVEIMDFLARNVVQIFGPFNYEVQSPLG
jgi:hypothetical protein